MKIMAVFGAIAVLLIAGLAVTMMAAPNVQASDSIPQVSINDQTLASDQSAISDNASVMHNFTVTIGAKVEGKRVPIADAQVIIYSVNVTTDATTNTTTIVLQKVAEEMTDANGVANFTLVEGKYTVIAHYHGLNGFGKINLTDDMSRKVMLHNWNGEFMNGMGHCKRVCIHCERDE